MHQSCVARAISVNTDRKRRLGTLIRRTFLEDLAYDRFIVSGRDIEVSDANLRKVAQIIHASMDLELRADENRSVPCRNNSVCREHVCRRNRCVSETISWTMELLYDEDLVLGR